MSRCCIRNGFRLFSLMLLSIAIFMMAQGCAHREKVWFSPRVPLEDYPLIGVIEFSTNAENTLQPYVTQNFIENIHHAQPGTRVLELGNPDRILGSVGFNEFNPEAIRSIGQKYNVDALVLGHFEVSEIMPKVKVNSETKAVNAKIYIEASLSTKLLETGNGATIWTRSTAGKSQVARFNLTDGGVFSLGVKDPREKYGKLVPKMVYTNTSDFRPYYEYRKVE